MIMKNNYRALDVEHQLFFSFTITWTFNIYLFLEGYFFNTFRDELQKNTSYLVTLSLKVGGGQDEITLLGAAKIVTRW